MGGSPSPPDGDVEDGAQGGGEEGSLAGAGAGVRDGERVLQVRKTACTTSKKSPI